MNFLVYKFSWCFSLEKGCAGAGFFGDFDAQDFLEFLVRGCGWISYSFDARDSFEIVVRGSGWISWIFLVWSF